MQEREQRFREFEHNYLGTRDDIEQQIKRETEEMLETMTQNVASNKQQVRFFDKISENPVFDRVYEPKISAKRNSNKFLVQFLRWIFFIR